jgi:peptide/nickel transport system substrate-binding protein
MSHNIYPGYLQGMIGLIFDATISMYISLRSNELWSNYSNPALDALINRARSTLNEKERQKICFEACKIIKEEVPTCLTYQQINLWGVNERVNWKAPPDERLFVFDMSFKK